MQFSPFAVATLEYFATVLKSFEGIYIDFAASEYEIEGETNDWYGKSCLSTSSKPPSLSTFNPRQGSSLLRRFNSSSSRISTKNKYPIRNEDETNEQTAEGGDEVNFLFHFPLPCFQVPVLDLLPCS